MSLFIKICGVTSPAMAELCARAGADAIGMVFAPSPRRIDVQLAQEIGRVAAPLARVGVFVDTPPDEIVRVAELVQLTHLQLHGQESPLHCQFLRQEGFSVIKAFRISCRADLEFTTEYPVDAVLVDSYVPGAHGGTGQRLDLTILEGFTFHRPLVLAGGLTPENVVGIMNTRRPWGLWGLDVSSGVEYQGRKCPRRMATFITRIRDEEDRWTREVR